MTRGSILPTAATLAGLTQALAVQTVQEARQQTLLPPVVMIPVMELLAEIPVWTSTVEPRLVVKIQESRKFEYL